MKQSMLCYSLLSGVLCIHLLAPKCLAAKSFGVSDELLGFARGLPTLRENALQRQNSSLVENPDSVVKMVERSINESRRKLDFLPCQSGNPIDDCWRCDPDWQLNRQRLADCSIGFGRNAIGGKNGPYYVVSDPSDNDAVNPLPGTLRHAVIQSGPLWIVFQRDMIIQLKEELIMNSYKTIDGRGVNVHIANGPCITIQYVNNIIIHGVNIHDCIPGGNAMVRDSPVHYGWRTISDGDGISIFGANHIWIDHCTLSNCKDGLIDAIMGSTAITISNSYFTHHNEVMLLGHNDNYVQDSIMQVTIAFNHFGEGLVQRMPRCRHGYFHIVNNDYTYWEMYAIGGSASPTINSQGNRFLAPMDPNAKEVTKRLNAGDGEWKGWNWRSEGDLMLNGAYFIPSGAGAAASYDRASSTLARPAALVGTLTGQAGVLTCSSDCSISGIGSGGSSGIGSGGGIGGGIGSGSGMGGGGYMGGIGGNGGYNGGTIGMGGAQVLLASHHIIYCIVCFACFVLMLDIRA